jgi:DNA helicase-2/ATP-dependent DNA helicase PcrA
MFDKVWYDYLYIQRKNYGLDFQDLLNFTLYILINDVEKKEKWQERLEYIMIDEFQDVDTKELAIAKILSDYHKNLFIVGDPDQTIYEWRRARVETILEFPEKFTPCTTIEMCKNYRSTGEVIKPANALIKYNKIRFDKEMQSIKTDKGQAVYYHAKTMTEEADWISTQILALQEKGISLSDIAVLYRAHYVSRPVEESFIKNNIEHILYSGVPFYGRKEIKDILSYLRMLINADDLSFERVVNEPNRGIGKTRMAFLQEYAEERSCTLYEALIYNADSEQFARTKAKRFIGLIEKYRDCYKDMTLTDLLINMLKDSGYEEHMRVAGEEDRLDNLAELKQSIFDYETTAGEETSLQTYLQHIALFTNDDRTAGRDAVNMMTVHTSKGLEFPYVFVCGMNEGIFPSRRANTERQLEEERRLAYVAFTRAEEKLFLTEAEGIDLIGQFRYPSRFVFNAEKANLAYVVELNDDLADETKRIAEKQEQKFSCKMDHNVGDKVNHEFFGIGVIIEADSDKFIYMIKFDGINTPRKIDCAVPLALA